MRRPNDYGVTVSNHQIGYTRAPAGRSLPPVGKHGTFYEYDKRAINLISILLSILIKLFDRMAQGYFRRAFADPEADSVGRAPFYGPYFGNAAFWRFITKSSHCLIYIVEIIVRNYFAKRIPSPTPEAPNTKEEFPCTEVKMSAQWLQFKCAYI